MSASSANPNETMTGSNLHTHINNVLTHLHSILRTSIGPFGFDKVLVDTFGNITTTNDGATILSSLKISDPFQQLICGLAKQVDSEVGDGTTTTALLAYLFVRNGLELKKEGLHTSTIVSGYTLAYKEIVNFIKSLQTSADLLSVVRTCISSKVMNDWFDNLSRKEKRTVEESKILDIFLGKKDKIGILKRIGRSMEDSKVLDGIAINCRAQGPRSLKHAKIICIDFDMKKTRMPLTVSITLNSPEDVEKVKQSELKVVMDRADKMIKSGVNVVLSTKGFDDAVLRKFHSNNIMTVRRIKKEDIEEVANILNIQVTRTLSDMEGNDSVLGTAVSDVHVEELDEQEVVVIGSKKYATLLLRGSSEALLDEMERSIHDARCMISRFKESKAVLPGGGAIECASYLYLQEFKESISSRETAAISKYAEALLDLPRLIISNAGYNDDLLAELLRVQSEGNAKSNKEAFLYGIDAESGKVQNQIKAGIVEPAVVKLKAIRAATEAAISVLRIEEMIVVEKEAEMERETCG